MKQFIARICIFTGVFLLLAAGVLFVERYNPRRLAFAAMPSADVSDKRTIHPISLQISSIGIQLSIKPAEIAKTWETTDQGVSYLTASTIPGEVGNGILYGHNYANLLGNLSKVKPGATIAVTLNTGEVREFLVEYTQTVTPDQTHILHSTEDRRITLYTCTGFMDSKRFVVVATLINSITKDTQKI